MAVCRDGGVATPRALRLVGEFLQGGVWRFPGSAAAIAAAAVLIAGLVGCGGSKSSGTSIFVTIAPITATIAPGATQQFTATVHNTTNTAVTWEVNGVAGGDAAHGTINSSGLYTAPGAIPTPPAITVTAVSVADTAQSGAASISVVAPIAVTPTTASVTAGATQQFTAQVSFSTNTAVTWQVNGVTGGNSSLGTISTAGLYTAPSTYPLISGVTVTAISQADSSKKASSSVTIVPPAITISPASATLSAGGAQAFTATALGTSLTPTWTLQCESTAAGACGSIATNGAYTAPLSPPPGGTVNVTASTSDGTTTPSSATVTIQFGNGSLTGPYVFSFNSQATTFSGEAGTLTFDGAGAISTGLIDNGGDGGSAVAITGGTYTVGTDGRGSATVQTGSGTINWTFTLVDHTHGFVVRDDGSNISATGFLAAQTATPAALAAGNYTLQVSGNASGSAIFEVGGIAADGSTTISSGKLDFAAPSGPSSAVTATGSYAAPSNGRGTLTLTSTRGTQQFAYYPIDAQHAALVEVDGTQNSAGELVSQPAGSFSTASLNGKYSFVMEGSAGTTPSAVGGVFTANGSGALSNRLVDSLSGVPGSTTGSYAVTDASLGRFTMTWTGSTPSGLVAYPRVDGSFAILEIDGAGAVAGVAEPVKENFLTVQALSGHFALQAAGALSNGTPEFISGQLVFPGGTTFSGTLDVTDGGALASGKTISGTLQPLDVNTGRGLAILSSSSQVMANANWRLYMLDANRVLLLDAASDRMLTGTIVHQY